MRATHAGIPASKLVRRPGWTGARGLEREVLFRLASQERFPECLPPLAHRLTLNVEFLSRVR